MVACGERGHIGGWYVITDCDTGEIVVPVDRHPLIVFGNVGVHCGAAENLVGRVGADERFTLKHLDRRVVTAIIAKVGKTTPYQRTAPSRHECGW